MDTAPLHPRQPAGRTYPNGGRIQTVVSIGVFFYDLRSEVSVIFHKHELRRGR